MNTYRDNDDKLALLMAAILLALIVLASCAAPVKLAPMPEVEALPLPPVEEPDTRGYLDPGCIPVIRFMPNASLGRKPLTRYQQT